MADRRLRRNLSQDEMNRALGCFILGYPKDMLLMSLVCPRVLSPECGTGNVRHLYAGGRERSTNEVQDRFLVVQARRHRFDNATTLHTDFQNAMCA